MSPHWPFASLLFAANRYAGRYGFIFLTSAFLFVSGCENRPALKVLRMPEEGNNLLQKDGWGPWQKGFNREGEWFFCNNEDDAAVQRGATQTVELNQDRPKPIVASAWSRAENVGGSRGSDYSLYLDLVYRDGSPLWGQICSFQVGTHDWERAEVVVLPSKPVRSVSFHLLLRRRTGRAWFRDPTLYEVTPPQGAVLFDGVPVALPKKTIGGFLNRDVTAGSDFQSMSDGETLGLRLQTRQEKRGQATFVDAVLSDLAGKDRAVTLVYALPVQGTGWSWLADPRRSRMTHAEEEYSTASRFAEVGAGPLSRYPFAAVSRGSEGIALGLDMKSPVFYRIIYNPSAQMLFIACDIGLAPEKNSASLRLCHFTFDPKWGFRSALQKYYELFPDDFQCRTPDQGLWMPFYKISQVKGWQDFGFKFMEGNNEVPWDDAHDILTFRYTEPHTYWMRMNPGQPRTMEEAISQARALAEKGDKRAVALLSSGYHDEEGQLAARFRDTPWCNGAVWSINSMPGIQGDVTDFKNSWNQELIENLYGEKKKADLDGEYVDSSEGYTTESMNYRRDHFAAARTPLVFNRRTHQPGIFRGLVAFEYVRAIARDMHARGKLMMANSTPSRLCWLAPFLDVLGTETNWNRNGQWRPMTDENLLYRRSICGPKPFCFLMNTVFEEFPQGRVEKYMKRCLAYGMFPGFFSHNASQGHYFSRPKLYNRDRPLFKKYVPLCKRVAEAGWQPITLARSSDPKIYVERFGESLLTIFNDSQEKRTAKIQLDGLDVKRGQELLTGREIEWKDGAAEVTLDGEDVAVLELLP